VPARPGPMATTRSGERAAASRRQLRAVALVRGGLGVEDEDLAEDELAQHLLGRLDVLPLEGVRLRRRGLAGAAPHRAHAGAHGTVRNRQNAVGRISSGVRAPQAPAVPRRWGRAAAPGRGAGAPPRRRCAWPDRTGASFPADQSLRVATADGAPWGWSSGASWSARGRWEPSRTERVGVGQQLLERDARLARQHAHKRLGLQAYDAAMAGHGGCVSRLNQDPPRSAGQPSRTLTLRIFSMSSSGGVPMMSVISCSWWMSIIAVARRRSGNGGTEREQIAQWQAWAAAQAAYSLFRGRAACGRESRQKCTPLTRCQLWGPASTDGNWAL